MACEKASVTSASPEKEGDEPRDQVDTDDGWLLRGRPKCRSDDSGVGKQTDQRSLESNGALDANEKPEDYARATHAQDLEQLKDQRQPARARATLPEKDPQEDAGRGKGGDDDIEPEAVSARKRHEAKRERQPDQAGEDFISRGNAQSPHINHQLGTRQAQSGGLSTISTRPATGVSSATAPHSSQRRATRA